MPSISILRISADPFTFKSFGHPTQPIHHFTSIEAVIPSDPTRRSKSCSQMNRSRVAPPARSSRAPSFRLLSGGGVGYDEAQSARSLGAGRSTLRSPWELENIACMAKWPRSKRAQVAIAFAVALSSAVLVFAQIAMESFNNFYFPPHKAYPYPYPTEWAAQIAMCRDCCGTFVVVFAIVYAAQRVFAKTQHNTKSN
jgi:hypothetical protein